MSFFLVIARLAFLFLITEFYLFSLAVKAQDIKSYEAELSTAKGGKKVFILNELCFLYSAVNSEKAVDYGNHALELSKKLGNDSLVAESAHMLGIAYLNKSNYRESITMEMLALKIREDIGYIHGIISSLCNISLAYRELGNYEAAARNLLSAIRIAEKNQKDNRTAAILYDNLGVLMKSLGRYTDALSYHRQSEKLSREVSDTTLLIKALGNIAIIYEKMQKPDSAIVINQNALVMAESKQMVYEQAFIHQNLGMIYSTYKKDQLNLRIGHYVKARDIYTQVKDNAGLSDVLVNLGNAQLQAGQIKNAENSYKEGLKYAAETGSLSYLLKANRALAKFYQETGEYEKSADYWKKAFEFKDSLYNKESSDQIMEMEAKYQSEVKERQLAQSRAAIIQNKLTLEKQNYMMALISLIFLSAVLAFVFIYRNQRQKQELLRKETKLKEQEAQIELKNKLQSEKSRISRELHDNIGSQLTVMMTMIEPDTTINETPEKESEIYLQAGNIMKELKKTVWLINEEEITLEDLALKLNDYLIKPLQKSKFSLNINFSEKTSEVMLNGQEALNILRVIQEAINNAIKYSGASEINIDFKVAEKGNYSIAIRDNGKGFDVIKIKRGNGLNNMQKRINDLRGNFTINSNEGSGTFIKIEMNQRAEIENSYIS